MKYAISLLVILVVACSCTKNDNLSFELKGKWIEKSQRFDTIDFDPLSPAVTGDTTKGLILRSKPYMDAAINPVYPVNPSSIFTYYFKGDSIHLYNGLMSAMIYRPYSFQSTGSNSFTIGKFYLRNSLPAQLEFEKLQ